jgi:sortase (surface protein transpeptidase)
MEAPSAPSGDPVWGKVFWYRGSGVLGASGTSTVAGHMTDMIGKPAVFSRLATLAAGDRIQVLDGAGRAMTFAVTEIVEYDLQQLADPAVLSRIYRPGPVSGQGALPSPDGKSYLTLVTCSGQFREGQFTHRLVAYAVRVAE